MHISLTERLEAWVRAKVESGLYNNASEVIREALRTQMRAEQTYQEKLDALRAEIDKGWAQADAGDVVEFDFDAIMKEVEAELADADDAPDAQAIADAVHG
ncbi:type II toxin-antitoxin system ParD family antitoxin [Alkalicaulis satelles]|uniref:Type II toxin-antitoxin system ParD family antitoxin n=1 Tax=Alkalicaulis satelles TaxID=2609175 RepID=A0A5M6ZC76_9PROT|nr:type II toxin-antitoxin system ParD family antitoxin [Alkalicaulis satelles]KAA5802322.1 type II toxin-antitoxin system ParD family antitoxin [Alkalicaulis satelles]